MQLFSPGRFSRLSVCFTSAVAGFAFAMAYTYAESPQFKNLFFASFILRTIHAFISGTFTTAIFLYRWQSNEQNISMIRERQPVIYWFAILSCIHLIPPLLRAPALLFTGGTGIFLLFTLIAIHLACRRAPL